MKSTKKIFLQLLLFVGLITVFGSCEKEETLWEGKQVGFERASARLMIPKDVSTFVEYNYNIMLIAAPQKDDITVTISIDTENSTAIEGTHFSLSSTSITVPAGESFGEFTIRALNSGFSFGGEFVRLVVKIESSSVDVAQKFSTFTLTISKESFIDTFSGVFTAIEYTVPDMEIFWGPYTVQCEVIQGTNSISMNNFWDFSTQAVIFNFNPDNNTVTVPLQVFNPTAGGGLGYSVEASGVFDAEEQTFEITANIFRGAELYEVVFIEYFRPGSKANPAILVNNKKTLKK